MPYGQNPQIQQTLEDISRGTYRSRGKSGKPVSGTTIVNRFAKQQDKEAKSVQRFSQGISQARAMEGLINVIPGKRKLDLNIGRSLEGLKGTRPDNLPLSKAGFVKQQKRMAGFGGALTDTIEQYGDQRYVPTTEDKATENRELFKGIVSGFKDDPRSMANTFALAGIAPIANLEAEFSGEKNLYNLLLATSSDTDRGDVIAAQSMFKDYGTKEDLGYAAMSITPGSAIRGLKVAADVGKLAGKGAMRYPKTAGALGASAGGLAYTQARPEEAEAALGAQILAIAKQGLQAPAKRPGRSEARSIAANVFSAMRNRGGGVRIPVSEMKERITGEDIVEMSKKDEQYILKNKAYIDMYQDSGRRADQEFNASHPPGMEPQLAPTIKPDHWASGQLNQLEKEVNGVRRAQGLEPLTSYKTIVEEGIKLANNGFFKQGSWNAGLARMSLKDAQEYMGAVGVRYWQ